jgi:hypothetical protein
MQGVLLEPPAKHWGCPSCSWTHVTRLAQPHAPMHGCPGAGGMQVFGTPVAQLAVVRHVVRERDDYIGGEVVQLAPDTGRPVMAVETHYADGRMDSAVYAPTATAEIGI